MIDPAAARRLVTALELTLTDEQEAVVFGAPDGPAVVVAGAGSGKTAVMAARIAVLIASRVVPPHEVLGLTFTRKAAAELAERVDSYLRTARRAGLVGPGTTDPDISTYHSFAQRFVREQGIRLGIDPDLRIESDFGLLPLAYRVVANSAALGQNSDHGFSMNSAVAAMRRLDGELAEHVVATDRLRMQEQNRIEALADAKPSEAIRSLVRASQSRCLLSVLVDEFREAKLLAGVMDYADMMRLAQQIAASSDDAVEQLRDTYATVLLDEYQDTSVVQRMLLQRLFGRGHQVLAVGDPKQSIYAFRGAAAGSIEAFGEHFPTLSGEPVTTFALSRNFRSGAAIVAVANDSEASRRAQRGMRTSVALTSARPDITDAVEVHTFRSADDERRFVVKSVAAELAEGTSASDILVLARNNDAVGSIAEALLAAGIPAISSDQAGLFELPAVRDVLAEMAVVVDPSANAELVRLLAGPRWRIGLRDLNLLGARARELAGAAWTTQDAGDLPARLHAAAGVGADPVELPCLADALADPGEAAFSDQARSRFALLAGELESLARYAGEPVGDLLARILHASGADVEILLGADAGWTSSAIDALFSLAASFAAHSPAAQAAGFLRMVRLARDAQADPGFDAPLPVGSVRVMTVHKAKGLQADVVLLPDFSAAAYDDVRLRDHWTTTAGSLPEDLRGDRQTEADLMAPLSANEVAEVRAAAKDAESQESERLVYVALTRARVRLVVSSHWWKPERVRARPPSGHLLALAAHRKVTTGAWYEPPPTSASNPLAAAVGEPEEFQFGSVDADLLARRQRQAGWVQPVQEDSDLDAASQEVVARWDADIAALIRERQQRLAADVEVRLPSGLSASAVQRLCTDPQGFAAALRRPMPTRPSRQARRGTRFHEWVAARWDQHALVDVSEYAADRELDRLDDGELAGLIAAFEAGEYADRAPHHVEYPFTVTLGGLPVVGRIDAVYTAPAQVGDADDVQRWEVVDWKTAGHEGADPLQLALYRLAWAKIAGVPADHVAAAFYYVPTGRRVVPEQLPDEVELAQLLANSISATSRREAGRRTSPR